MKEFKSWSDVEEEYITKFKWIEESEERICWVSDTIKFFKPYFQEKMHEEAVEELEIGIYCTQCDNNKPRVPGGILMLCEKCSKKLRGK